MEIKELWEVINDQKIKHQDFVYQYRHDYNELERELNNVRDKLNKSEEKMKNMQGVIDNLINQIKTLSTNNPPVLEDDNDSDTGSFITHDIIEDNNKNCCIM